MSRSFSHALPLALALVVLSGPPSAAQSVEVEHEIRGAGLLLRWTLDEETANRTSSQYLIVSDGPGRTLVRETLSAAERERFLDVWLDEGESLSVRLFLALGGGAMTPAPPRTVNGPFHQVDLAAEGSVEDIRGTNCTVRVELPEGREATVGIFQGPDLLGAVEPSARETALTGLDPGARYALALIPVVEENGGKRRGRRTLLPPFVTKLEDAWVPVNEGKRLSGDEEAQMGWGRTLQAFTGPDGDLLFTVPGGNLGTGLGRYSLKARTWQVRGLEGWTDDHAVVLRPVFDGLFSVRELHIFEDRRMGLQAIADVSVSSGEQVLDIHGSVHHFRWADDQWEQYAGGTAFSRYDSRPLFNSWDGSGAGWGFDANRSGVGLAVHVKGSLSANGRLVAVRLDPADAKNLWSVWRDGAWQAHGYDVSFLPDPSPPKSLEDKRPSVICLDERNLWLVLFRRTAEAGKTAPFWTALLYDDSKPAWFRWTAEGWKPEGELVPFLEEGPDERTVRVFRERRGTATILGRRGRDLLRWEYRQAGQRVSGPETLSSIEVGNRYAPSYAAVLSPGGKLHVFYSEDGSSITLHGEGRIFASAKPLALGDAGFVKRVPVVFYVSEGELRAVAEHPLVGENAAPAPPVAAAETKKPDGRAVTYLGSFVNYATDPVVPEGSRMPVGASYGPQASGHMAATAEGLVIAPRFVVCNVCLFPPDHPEERAVFWGGFWDYFLFPMGCAVDEKRGRVYVAHRVTSGGCGGLLGGQVDVWDLAEASKCHWVKPGLRGSSREREVSPARIDDLFKWPSGMAVDGEGGFLYVANSLTSDVRKFRLTGPEPERVGVIGTGELDFPRGVAVGREGEVYVVDSRHHRVCVFDGAGELLRSFGGAGREPGKFLYPWGIAICPRTGTVFVSDPCNDRIQAFDGEGKLVSWWNAFDACELGSAEEPAVPVVDPRARAGPEGNHDRSFGLACDGRGFLYVSTGSHIAKFKVEKREK